MNPGLVVKLRPSGPWRIGPDSGARNRVDFIYHSDTLYSAVTAAMARLGSLDAWLDATARRAEAPQVCFSSCFPFLDEIGFIVPPRTVWPPVPRAPVAGRVRWKSARFVPLGVVQAVLAGQELDDNHWTVDGPSECLVPAGRPGPFRTTVRWSAAVDRLTGSAERHSTACLEFRPGAGMWAIVSFVDEAARDRWSDPVKAALRLLADTGFGGERSRGWGRSASPEFIEGTLPEMILPPIAAPVVETESVEPAAEPTEAAAEVVAPAVVEPLVVETPEVPGGSEPSPASAAEPLTAPSEPTSTLGSEAAGQDPAAEPEAGWGGRLAPAQTGQGPAPPSNSEPEAPTPNPESPTPEALPVPEPEAQSPIVEAAAPPPSPEPVAAEGEAPIPDPQAAGPEAEAPAPGPRPPASEEAPSLQPPTPEVVPPTPGVAGHWLLSLFAPAPSDAVDWRRGNYTVLVRGGRIDSPAASGELKKQVQMVAEGSVVYAPSGPRGAAPDVAPDGFPHPVFRAGFAVSIPLPEVS